MQKREHKEKSGDFPYALDPVLFRAVYFISPKPSGFPEVF